MERERASCSTIPGRRCYVRSPITIESIERMSKTEITDSGIYREGQDGEMSERLTNFVAKIERQQVTIDGNEQEIVYLISGRKGKKELPELSVPADKFRGMKWVGKWPVGPLVYPLDKASDYASMAIIEAAEDVETEVTYGSLGWQVNTDGEEVYVTVSEAISAKEAVPVSVKVPADLSRYEFGDCQSGTDSMIATPGNLGPLLHAYAVRSAIGDIDFGMWVHGRSGSFKSEIAACLLHYFGDFTGRTLPSGWASTGNAIEALAYRCKDSLLVVDDYVPSGSSFKVKALAEACDRVFRGLGNRQGRARMDEKAGVRQTYYPRGGILSTGEDVAEGNSMRGRMLILECSVGTVSSEFLTELQGESKARRFAMRKFVEWLADDRSTKMEEFRRMCEKFRASYHGIGHPRTPDMLASLLASVVMWSRCFNWDEKATVASTHEALVQCGNDQTQYLVSSDVASASVEALKQGFAAGKCHVMSNRGGEPQNSLLFGWKSSGSGHSRKPQGPMLGWVNASEGHVYFMADEAYAFVKRATSGAVAITRQSWCKRLKEGNHLAVIDEEQGRIIVRRRCAGTMRRVIVMSMEHLNLIEEEDEDERNEDAANWAAGAF